MNELLTIGQACKQMDISERTFRRMVASGEFPPPIRRNRRWVRVPAQDVRDYQNKLLDSRQTHTKQS